MHPNEECLEKALRHTFHVDNNLCQDKTSFKTTCKLCLDVVGIGHADRTEFKEFVGYCIRRSHKLAIYRELPKPFVDIKDKHLFVGKWWYLLVLSNCKLTLLVDNKADMLHVGKIKLARILHSFCMFLCERPNKMHVDSTRTWHGSIIIS
jgi:hypothetical protein